MRLIDAEEILVGCVKTGLKEYDTGKEAGIDLVLAIINHLPTIEAKPVVHAHWVDVSGGRIICSNCGNYPLYDYWGKQVFSNVCPHCDAQMDESISCSYEDDKPISQAHENGVKIPVINLEDVPKIMEEMENNA